MTVKLSTQIALAALLLAIPSHAVTVRFRTHCTPVGRPVSARLYFQPRYSPVVSLVASRTVQASALDSFSFDETRTGTALVTTLDVTGAESCALAVGLNLTTGLDSPPELELPELYDLAGRRIHRTTRSGVYFERVGSRTRRIVVLR